MRCKALASLWRVKAERVSIYCDFTGCTNVRHCAININTVDGKYIDGFLARQRLFLS